MVGTMYITLVTWAVNIVEIYTFTPLSLILIIQIMGVVIFSPVAKEM